MELVSVIIPTRNRLSKLERCVASVLQSTYKPLEIIVVDDASSGGSSSMGMLLPNGVRLIRNEKRRLLAYSRQAGAEAADGDLLFFLDDDNVIDPLAIQELAGLFQGRPDAAVTCPVIYYASRPTTIWTSHISKRFLPGFYTLQTEMVRDGAVSFSFHDAFMIRKDVFFDAGGFDFRNFPIHFSELDLAVRLGKRGYRSYVSARAMVWHDVSPAHMHVDNTRSYYTLRNRIILLRKHSRLPEKILYVVYVLPFLYIYYCAHHMKATDESIRKVPKLLLQGIINGLAVRIRYSDDFAHATKP